MKVAVNGKVVDITVNETAEEIPVYAQIQELKQKLADTDYQAIKYAEGQLMEYEYAEMRLRRQEWRNKINELEQML